MKTRRVGSIVSCVVVGVLLSVATPVRGEAPRAPGASTGDGSTVFTGLAQAPEANLFVGAATTAIPIEVPPGRKSLTPKLALSYASGAGASAYGYGWDLPLGRIQRCGKHGVLSCTDPTYRNDFVLVLPGATVECTLDTSTGLCTPEVEDAFLRIQYTFNRWDVWDKSGLHYRFGATDTGRAGSNVFTLFNGPNVYPPCTYTNAWALDRIEDPSGNTIEITYSQIGGVLYPDTIRYGGNTGLAHPFEVDFAWIPRPADDQSVSSIGGFTATLTQLLARIDVRYGTRTVRSYHFDYEFQTATTVDDRIGRQSFLSAVTLFDGGAGSAARALARADGTAVQTTFLYHQNAPASGRFGFGVTQLAAKPLASNVGRAVARGNAAGIGSYRESTRDVLDMNGDGIADLVDTNACTSGARFWNVYLGSAAGFSATSITWESPEPNWGCGLRWLSTHANGDSATWFDTFDIDGDGIPDWVNSTTMPWTVYKGHPPTTSSGWGFGPAPIAWSAPRILVRQSLGDTSNFFGNPSGTKDTLDVIDMNGDGLLDLADAAAGRVWLNTGTGFETGPGTTFNFQYGRLRYTADQGTQILGVYDINGDGLPDQILASSGFWSVHSNTGHELNTVPEYWTVPDECGRLGLRDTYDHAHDPFDVGRDLFDINGDGLPDVVDVCGWSAAAPVWKVYVNRGRRFSATPYPWSSPSPILRDVNDHDDRAGDYTYTDVFDADGDGLVDFVDFTDPAYVRIAHSAGGAWCASNNGTTCTTYEASSVAANPNGARPDLLEWMENGVGGSTHLAYRPSTQWDNSDGSGVPQLPYVMWTVTRIDQDDGLCDDSGHCLSPGAHALSTDLTYWYGVFNPTAREFRGFGSVQQTDVEGNVRTNWFLQDAARRGKLSTTLATDATAHVLFGVANTWVCFDADQGTAADCPDLLPAGGRRGPRLSQSLRVDATADVYTRFVLTRNLAWDGYGNITHVQKSATAVAPVDTYTSYTYWNVPAGQYLVDRPAHVEVVDGGTTTLEEKWFTYDAKGNVTGTSAWLDRVAVSGLPQGGSCPGAPRAGTGTCVTTLMAYDTYGNVASATDANGHVTTTSYDGTRIYPATVTDALNHVVATAYDPGCGKLLSQTVSFMVGQDPTTQPSAKNQYDAFCRLQATAPPDGTLGNPQRQYFYYLGSAGQATDILTVDAVAGSALAPTRWAESDVLFDALGRTVQAQRDAVVDGSSVTVVDGTTIFDARGNSVQRCAPFTLGGGAIRGAYAVPPAAAGVTLLEYDALGRATRVTNPDGSVRTIDHSAAGQTTTKDECYTAGTCPGSKIVEIRDGFGRTTQKQTYDGDIFVTRVGYTYDGLGRLRETRQGASLTTWGTDTTPPDTRQSVTFDSLGRKIQLVDPDSGVWTYGYDPVGGLVYQDDPKTAQHTQFTYDILERIADKYTLSTDAYCDLSLPSCTAAVTDHVAYVYDQPATAFGCSASVCAAGNCGLGRLTSATEDRGGATMLCYDTRGRHAAIMTQIMVNNHASVGATLYSYDGADHVTSMTYPDGEVVTYGYDAVGNVESLNGTVPGGAPVTYLTNLTYDVYGRSRQITHGNNVVDTHEYYDKAQSFRLSRIVSALATGTARQDLSYQYQANGLLKTVTDRGPAGQAHVLDNTASLTYDGLGRLTQAGGTNLPAPNTYAYDAFGNMTLKEGSALAYDDPNRPHRLTKINGAATGIAHDANGNRTGKPGQVYTYDGDDHLVGVNGGAVQFAYDYAGRRVATMTGTSVTRHFGPHAEVTDGWLTKYYTAGGMLSASQRVPAFQLAALPSDPAIQVVQAPSANPALMVVLRTDARYVVTVAGALLSVGLLLAPWRRKRVVGVAVRHGHVIGVIVAFSLTTLPLPLWVQPAWGRGRRWWWWWWRWRPGPTYTPSRTPTRTATPTRTRTPTRTPTAPGGAGTTGVLHFHLDHLGSTQVITKDDGSVFQYVRFTPYGSVRGHYNPNGTLQAVNTCADDQYCREFTGYRTEPVSGLQYAGARFYDPGLGMFLTHDPARQFASPYTYTSWNPTNLTDPNGAFIEELVIAVVVAAVASAAVNTVVAAAQGASLSQIGKAAAVGAVSGAVSVGLGVVISGVSIGVSSLAGTLPQNVGLNQALNALGEVAYRAAFSSIVANAAGQTAAAAGAPGEAVSGISLAAGYGASYAYDSSFINYSGDLAKLEAKEGFQTASNTATHTGITEKAATLAGFSSSEGQSLLRGNLDQDAVLRNNQSHFGYGAQAAFKQFAKAAVATRNLSYVGAASHYIQDQYALGHTFPGTNFLSGLAGAPFRFLVHQTVGGEVNFFRVAGGLRIPSSFDATFDYFSAARAQIPAGAAL